MRRTKGFTLIELLVVISIIALLIGILLPALGAARRTANKMKNSANLRGIAQSAVIHANENNQYFPGIDFDGTYLLNTDTDGNGYGYTPEARFWVLLSEDYIPSDLLENPQDALTESWTSNALTTSMYSYAALNLVTDITTPAQPTSSSNRLAEWQGTNITSSAVLMGDRNTAQDTNGTAGIQSDEWLSLWVAEPGNWEGNVVYGDVHAEFLKQPDGLQTRYSDYKSTNDNLFLSADNPDGEDNAFLVWGNSLVPNPNF